MRKQWLYSILLSLLIVTVLFAYWVIDRRNNYSYDVTRSYQYAFTGTDSQHLSVDIVDGRFKAVVPDGASTIILKLDIDSGLSAFLWQPTIRLHAKGKDALQAFEYGARGVRYIDITSLLDEEGLDISLHGEHLNVDDQGAELIVFETPTLPERVLILSPHPDDAEIAAFGLYSSLPSDDVFVVTVTRGDAGPKKYDEVYDDRHRHYQKKGELRFWNSLSVPMMAGVPAQQVLNLAYFDGALKRMKAAPEEVIRSKTSGLDDLMPLRSRNLSALIQGVAADSTWVSLVADMAHLLREIQPTVIVTPYPAIDTNADHKLTSLALFEAIKTLDIRTGRLFLYSNHHPASKLVPYGPAGSLIALPPSYDDDLFVRAMYSHALDGHRQQDKLMALEAMNDLRLDTEWLQPLGVTRIAIDRYKDVLIGSDDYFRRAVRPNELFFVIDIEDLYDEQIYQQLQQRRRY